MSDDPYRPPDSELRDNGRPPLPRPSAIWRVFFSFNCLLIVLNILSIPFAPEIGIMEVVDFTFTNVVFVGLCGFIFQKSLGNLVFWRYFFYAALAEAVFVIVIYPVFGLSLYGQKSSFDGWFVFNLFNTYFNLLALNLYAYKLKGIW